MFLDNKYNAENLKFDIITLKMELLAKGTLNLCA